MPFEDGAFDFIVCCAAFKNFSDPVDALREMRRVLAPGGTALIVDLRPDVSAEAVDDDVTRMGLGAVRGAITKFTLRSWPAKRAYTPESFVIARTDFASSDIRETPMSLEVALHR
jgi:ubiquinone/menaquinone biosynthesis C-methylase UbiE